jgi:hypothetical protein
MTMEPMGFWQLVGKSPEWVGVFTSTIFAAVTIVVIIWQGCMMKAQVRVMKLQVRVMRWQSHFSARHERIQNRLIHLQHEHEWIIQKNREREQILAMARKLHLAVNCLELEPSRGDALSWGDVQDTARELGARLRILDVSTYAGSYDQWFPNLEEYVDAIQKAMIDDWEFNKRNNRTNLVPNEFTRKALKGADDFHKPNSIFLDIEIAIRMEFFEFKQKWDAALPT